MHNTSKVVCWSCSDCLREYFSNTSNGKHNISRESSENECFKISRSESGFEEPYDTRRSVSSVNMRKSSSISYVDEDYRISAAYGEEVFNEQEEFKKPLASEAQCMDHIFRVMSPHSSYLQVFTDCHRYLMDANGPLPYSFRHYIAIMAASRHFCSYLVTMATNEFISIGGDERWLKSLNEAPLKLQNLAEINRILAHAPWNLSTHHIQQLTSGNEKWSMSELGHAFVLIAHYHALSSFVQGCGLRIVSPNNGDTQSESSGSESDNASDLEIESIITRMKHLSSTNERKEFMSPNELLLRFEAIETETALLPVRQRRSKNDGLIFIDADVRDKKYEDFAHSCKASLDPIQAFEIRDFSWEDHGYCSVGRLYIESGDLLDRRFKVAQKLTYNVMGDHNDVDTIPFRRAVWNYVQCIYGMRHDGYDYAEVNDLLDRRLRTYVKMAAFCPQNVTSRSYTSFIKQLLPSEKIHINILIMEARLQSELLYGFKCISRFYGLNLK